MEWLVALDVHGPVGALAARAALEEISTDERDRALRHRRRDDRVRTLAAQWLARRVVADAAGATSDDLVLRRDARGRLQAPGRADVSVAHTGRWVVVAAIDNGAVGVDVEAVERLRAVDPAAYLSPVERAVVADAGCPALHAARHWTAKEAVAKLRGHGLVVDPRTIDVDSAALSRDGTSLRVTIGPDRDHLVAVAWRRTDRTAADPSLTRWEERPTLVRPRLDRRNAGTSDRGRSMGR